MSKMNGKVDPAFMSAINGERSTARNVNTDDISVTSGDDDTDMRNEGRESQLKGPWVNSSQNYSRSENKPETEICKERTESSRIYMWFCVICILVFLVGIGLGIVIGTFALKENSEPEDDQFLPPSSQILNQITSSNQFTTTERTSSQIQNQITSSNQLKTTERTLPTCLMCGSRDPDISTGNEISESLFAPMTFEEMSKVIVFLKSVGVVSTSSDLRSNRVSYIYLNPVDKALALNYLDNGGQFPGRFARAHVIRGMQKDIMEYKIGPLHETSDRMTITNLLQDGQISFDRRPFDIDEKNIMGEALEPHFAKMNTIFRESFDGASLGNGVYFNVLALPSEDPSTRRSMAYLYLDTSQTASATLRILPVTCLLTHSGNSPKKWIVSDFYYLSQGPFLTAQDLLDAYNNNQLRKFAFPSGFLQKMADYSLKLNTTLPPRSGSENPPPRTYQPAGPRYTIKGNRVSWLGWEFEFTVDPQRGPAVFDVKFKGRRIAYEISLQDVTLIYASQTNGAGSPVYSDTHYQLGDLHRPRPGVDCPHRASYLTTTTFFYGERRSVAGTCVFETDGEIPLWRHGSRGLADHYLVIRSPMDLGNYDYSLQWIFRLDGSIETQISASGYLYGAFWDPNDPLVDEFKSSTPFGYRISDYLLGPIHDHSFTFKVDLDILGTSNSLETLHWKGGHPLNALRTQTNVNTAPGYFYFNSTRYIQYDILNQEQGFSLDPVNPKYWTIVNENERNIWGVKRGYRIIPHSTSAEHLLDHVMFNAWEHLKYNMAVTKRKESEPYATDSLYDLSHPGQSFRGVGKMLNNENVRNEDLVLWVTEKFLHAPSSEDVPMTLQIHKGFSLKPFNYFDRTPTFDVPGHYNMNESYSLTPCLENI